MSLMVMVGGENIMTEGGNDEVKDKTKRVI